MGHCKVCDPSSLQHNGKLIALSQGNFEEGERINSSMENSEWYALHVRPRFERVVAFHLKKQNIEYCLPFRRLSRKSSIRPIELPLLPGYVFCYVQTRESRSLLTIPGVLNVLGIAVEGAIPKSRVLDLKTIKGFEDLLDRRN